MSEMEELQFHLGLAFAMRENHADYQVIIHLHAGKQTEAEIPVLDAVQLQHFQATILVQERFVTGMPQIKSKLLLTKRDGIYLIQQILKL